MRPARRLPKSLEAAGSGRWRHDHVDHVDRTINCPYGIYSKIGIWKFRVASRRSTGEFSVMTPDWSRVTLEHVRRACQMYDSGAALPKRPARSTFLLLNGKTYPAKFIRGLAYRLATGVELDPNRDYSGGEETARFFQGLGLATQHGSFHPGSTGGDRPRPAVSGSPAPPPPGQPSASAPHARQEPQKEALAALLHRRFGRSRRRPSSRG